MNKRYFLQNLLGLTAGLALREIALGRALSSSLPAREALPLQVSPLAGFQFYEGSKLWAALNRGDTLDLRREPQNPYDGNAVAVFWRNQKLGYLPRDENTAVAQLLDSGQCLGARIENLQESKDPWQRVELGVWLTI